MAPTELQSDTSNVVLLRSMLDYQHNKLGANFRKVGDAEVVASYVDNEIEQAKLLAIADLTVLPRIGYKSRQTSEWLTAQGVSIPDNPNQSVRQDDGCLVASLSWDEYLVLAGLSGESATIDKLVAAYQHEAGFMCYPLLRAHSHCCFLISGERASELFAKVCGVDLRAGAFVNGQVAQTSVARNNSIVIRNDLGQIPAYYLLTDSASAEFMWRSLLDAMQEYPGRAVGLDCLLALQS